MNKELDVSKYVAIGDPTPVIELIERYLHMLAAALKSADKMPDKVKVEQVVTAANEVMARMTEDADLGDMIMIIASLSIAHGYLKGMLEEGLLVKVEDLMGGAAGKPTN